MTSLRIGLLLRLLLATAAALAGTQAAAQAVDLQRSSILVTARQMNVPFEGQFRSFRADLAWDESRPEASKATVEIDLSSFDLGDPAFNEEARGKAFLDAARIPRATFTATSIRRVGAGRYEATGRLGIKGITRELSVPFTVRDEGGRRVFEASFPLMRLDFRIGEGEWADTGTLANETRIQVRLVTLIGN